MNGVHLEQVSVWFGDVRVLNEVDLHFPAGSITALIGPSGCGKSTLLRLLNRLVDESSDFRFAGRVLLGDEDVFAAGVQLYQLRRRVGTVFSQPVPFPGSVFDNVAFGPRLAGMRSEVALAERVESALVEAGLWDEMGARLDSDALALAPGPAQRMCIARALALDPEVLVLDEPTAFLDPIATGQVESVLRAQRGERTVLLATRDAQQAARVADHTAFMERGRVVEVAPTEELFTRPREAATEAFLSRRYN